MNKKNIKKRYWSFVCYPESLPIDWLDTLILTGLPFAISPLHDSDLDPTGEVKKPHYHVILCYSGPTTFNSVCEITNSLNQPNPQPLESVKGYFRYFTHKDNPDKFQYLESDIRCYNSFNIFDYSDLTRAEVVNVIKNVQILIRDEDFIEYCDLCDYLLENVMMTEYDVVTSHTLFFDKYISSRRCKRR